MKYPMDLNLTVTRPAAAQVGGVIPGEHDIEMALNIRKDWI
jgi:hypothetical protein